MRNDVLRKMFEEDLDPNDVIKNAHILTRGAYFGEA
jgi:hypothetical protein